MASKSILLSHYPRKFQTLLDMFVNYTVLWQVDRCAIFIRFYYRNGNYSCSLANKRFLYGIRLQQRYVSAYAIYS